MAQVKMFGLRRTLAPVRAALSDAVHGAVMEAFAYPAEKRFHRFILLDDADFIYPRDRSDRYVIIELSVFEGRSAETKKRLIRKLYHRIPDATGIVPHDIEGDNLQDAPPRLGRPRPAWRRDRTQLHGRGLTPLRGAAPTRRVGGGRCTTPPCTGRAWHTFQARLCGKGAQPRGCYGPLPE